MCRSAFQFHGICSIDCITSILGYKLKVMKITNKMQLYRLIYYSKSALHVSGDVLPVIRST